MTAGGWAHRRRGAVDAFWMQDYLQIRIPSGGQLSGGQPPPRQNGSLSLDPRYWVL